MLKILIWHYVIDNAVSAFFHNVSANFIKQKNIQIGDEITVYLEGKPKIAQVIQLYGHNPVVMLDNFRCTCFALKCDGTFIYTVLYKISPDGLTHWVRSNGTLGY